MKKLLFVLLIGLVIGGLYILRPQDSGFVIQGYVPGMPDSTCITLLSQERVQSGTWKEGKSDVSAEVNQQSSELAVAYSKDGKFELRGAVDHPTSCTLVTHNQIIVQKTQGPYKWTYSPIFVSNTVMTVKAKDFEALASYQGYSDDVEITGGQPQEDLNEYHRMVYEQKQHGGPGKGLEWEFIQSHPHSVLSLYFAGKLLVGSYSLTQEQLETLEKSIVSVPEDTLRFRKYQEALTYAKHTPKEAPLLDMELLDLQEQPTSLLQVVPKGKYVFIDFWASWCGICIASMPPVVEASQEYSDVLTVVAVSCDKNREAWKKAVERIQVPFPHYVMTAQGYSDFFHKFAVKNGVPYYLLVDPQGRVVCAPGKVKEILPLLDEYRKSIKNESL